MLDDLHRGYGGDGGWCHTTAEVDVEYHAAELLLVAGFDVGDFGEGGDGLELVGGFVFVAAGNLEQVAQGGFRHQFRLGAQQVGSTIAYLVPVGRDPCVEVGVIEKFADVGRGQVVACADFLFAI